MYFSRKTKMKEIAFRTMVFDLKAPIEGLLSYLNKRYMHRTYTIHEYQKIERSITINKAKGNIKLHLLTKETINETLSKIKK